MRNQADHAALQAGIVNADKIDINQRFGGSDTFRCPRDRGGCGGEVETLQTAWLRESRDGASLSSLGDRVAPPRQPVLGFQRPDDPDQSLPPRPDPPDLTGEDERFDQMLSTRGTSITVKVAGIGIPVLCTLGVAIHQESPNGGNPILAVAVGCAVFIAVGIIWFKIATAPISAERDRLFKARREEHHALLKTYEAEASRHRAAYKIALERFQDEQSRFDTEILTYEEDFKIWQGSWQCRSCTTKWRDYQIDRGTTRNE